AVRPGARPRAVARRRSVRGTARGRRPPTVPGRVGLLGEPDDHAAELQIVSFVSEARHPAEGLDDHLLAVMQEGDRAGLGRRAQIEGVENLARRGVHGLERPVLARVEDQVARRGEHPPGIAVLRLLISPDFPARSDVSGFVHLVPPDELLVGAEVPDVSYDLDLLTPVLHT